MDLSQLDLFDDRHVRLTRARAALADGQVDAARHELLVLRGRYPADELIGRELARTQRLLGRLGEIEHLPDDERAPALLALAQDLAPEASAPGDSGGELGAHLRAALLRRVAEELRNARGHAGLLDGLPPGYYLLAGGDLAAAAESLEAALTIEERAIFPALLGDVAHVRSDRGAARRWYGEALLLDPWDVPFDLLRDEDVRGLPLIAERLVEPGEEPLAWSAAVGSVTGVLSVARCRRADTPPREALSRARAFVDALARATSGNGPDIIKARREMKRLAPGLFAMYMESLGGER